jgi:hypothetical protein
METSDTVGKPYLGVHQTGSRPVRGLGAPVRFTLTGGQRGDYPQAYALIEGLPAEVVMADAA